MKSMKHSQAFLRRRKMLVVLPLLVIPFCTMAFWALGGGKGNDTAGSGPVLKGLNLQLPNANLKDEPEDKLSFYEKAEKDSIKMAEFMRNDPYYKQQQLDADPFSTEMEEITQESAAKHNQLITSPYRSGGNEMIEQKVLNRIGDLQKELNKSGEHPGLSNTTTGAMGQADAEYSSQMDRLEDMLKSINQEGTDPEMEQVENALDKILDIQHPQRVADRLKEKSQKNKEMVFAVTASKHVNTVGILDTIREENNSKNVFFGVDNPSYDAPENNSIQAVVHEGQVLVSGAIVKLRLINDVYINGILVPKDNFVFGVASLSGERLEIEISSVRYQRSLFPVKLTVYDLDGLPGIYIPGAISRDVAKQSGDNSLQTLEMTTMDPSLKAQAAAAGIGAAKNLISKKVKLVRVMVKPGYKVLLKDTNQQ